MGLMGLMASTQPYGVAWKFRSPYGVLRKHPNLVFRRDSMAGPSVGNVTQNGTGEV